MAASSVAAVVPLLNDLRAHMPSDGNGTDDNMLLLPEVSESEIRMRRCDLLLALADSQDDSDEDREG